MARSVCGSAFFPNDEPGGNRKRTDRTDQIAMAWELEYGHSVYIMYICRSICPMYIYIAIENGDLQWIYPLKMVIFHGYVSLPEGIQISHCQMDQMGGCYAKTS